MPNLISVDIRTGRVRENNLRQLWAEQASGMEAGKKPGVSTPPGFQARGEPAETGQRGEGPQLPVLRTTATDHAADGGFGTATPPPAPPDEALRERIRRFNSGRRRRNKNAWSDDELYRLAVLMGRQKRNYKQAAARLARTPRACQFMFREMVKEGVL